jgi:hypothetical protein
MAPANLGGFPALVCLSRRGAVLDPQGVIGAAPTTVSTRRAGGAPELTLGGPGYVVVWDDEPCGHLYAGRFDASLAARDGDGVDLAPMVPGGLGEPALAASSAGADVLLGLTHWRTSSTVRLVPFNLGTLAVADAAPVATQARDQSAPSIA